MYKYIQYITNDLVGALIAMLYVPAYKWDACPWSQDFGGMENPPQMQVMSCKAVPARQSVPQRAYEAFLTWPQPMAGARDE